MNNYRALNNSLKEQTCSCFIAYRGTISSYEASFVRLHKEDMVVGVDAASLLPSALEHCYLYKLLLKLSLKLTPTTGGDLTGAATPGKSAIFS